nr:AAA family ATPase [Aquitalea sp. FJL05]
MDANEEKNSLTKLFNLLGLDKKKYESKLNLHFEKFNTISKRAENAAVTVDQFAILYNTWRSHSFVQEYKELQKKESIIFQSKDVFLKILNELFDGTKTAQLSDGNELYFKTKNGKEINIEDLSSGEKQLLIILGEALLQKSDSYIYIADEPELSLHISWQEKLTASISQLNPNAQILFATHSPDIVSIHGDNAIEMEACFS